MDLIPQKMTTSGVVWLPGVTGLGRCGCGLWVVSVQRLRGRPRLRLAPNLGSKAGSQKCTRVDHLFGCRRSFSAQAFLRIRCTDIQSSILRSASSRSASRVHRWIQSTHGSSDSSVRFETRSVSLLISEPDSVPLFLLSITPSALFVCCLRGESRIIRSICL